MSDPAPIRVIVIARQPMVRAGLSGLLAERADLQVVGQARSADEAADSVIELEPDVVLVASQLDEAREMSLHRLVSKGDVPVVLVADSPSAPALGSLLESGLRGFLLPETTADEVGAALIAVAQGLTVLSPAAARLLTTGVGVALTDSLTSNSVEALTEREREVLRFLAAGLPNKTIASRLQISEHTVKFHVGAILAKLGATSRTEAVTRAVRQGLIAL
ncbi:MAG TPA: response regulator transcription factor [Chloroflexota bacterium]|nr:response regulator transcription factor [Chloroflexota bacterium]